MSEEESFETVIAERDEAIDVIYEMLRKINCMPICSSDFLGDELYSRIQKLFGEDLDEDEDEEDEE